MITPEYLQKINESQIILSRFAHEIRNPLSLVVSELQLMAELHPEITGYKDWDIILSNLSYIEDLLNDFSSYGNSMQLSRTPTAFAQYITHLIDSIRPSMEYLNIQLITDISPDLPVLNLDQRKFQQAFLNIARNAQEAIASPNGQIKIECNLNTEQKVCLTVSDNGIGLSEEQLARIFIPFVTYKSSGTGLGLSIARQIIEAHGGSLHIKGSPGHGCTAFILLGR